MSNRASAGGRRPGSLETMRTLERHPRSVMLPPMIGATILFLLGSFAHFLPGAGMAALDPAALASFALLAVLGGGFAAAFALAGPIGQALLMGFIFYFVAQLHIPAVDPFIAFPVGLAAGFWKPRSLSRLVGVVFAVVFVTALLAPRASAFDEAPPGAAGNAALPPLLHVIVDEVGPDPRLPTDRFSQWTAAHSRYHVTKASLPEMTDRFYAALLERGYDLEIWRTDYVLSCPDGARCARHRNFHFDAVRARNMPLLREVQIAIYAWLRTGQQMEKIFDQFDPMVGASHVSPLTSLDALERARLRAERLAPGEALSLHVLLPHYPYSLDRQCALKPFEGWVGRSPAFPVENRRVAYDEQLACIADRVADIGRDDMVIVIHGDHGTRYFDIKASQTDLPLREELLRQAFATPFALHLPGVAPESVERPASISSLLEELAAGDFDRIPEGREESLFIGIDEFRQVER